MTNAELNTTILGLKDDMLEKYGIYFNKMSIGSKITTDRQRTSLKAVNLYIKILDYYYNISEAVRGDESSISEEEILVIIGEADKILDTFKSSYYVN